MFKAEATPKEMDAGKSIFRIELKLNRSTLRLPLLDSLLKPDFETSPLIRAY